MASAHAIPAGIDIQDWQAILLDNIPKRPDIQYGNGLDQTPTAIVYEDDLTAGEAATYDELAQAYSAKQGLSDKIQLARDHAADIMPLFNTILDQTLNQTTQPARYDTIRAVVDGSAAGFRAAFHGDLLQEMGIDASAALTAAQQRQYCVYARVWVNQVGLLLSLA